MQILPNWKNWMFQIFIFVNVGFCEMSRIFVFGNIQDETLFVSFTIEKDANARSCHANTSITCFFSIQTLKHLTHFMPQVYFYTPWKHQKTSAFRVSKVSWKFPIPAIYNFAVIYPQNVLFSLKVAYFLTVSIVFLFINFTTQ